MHGKGGISVCLFEVITGFDSQVLCVLSVHFGTRNDQHMVGTDETVSLICTGWYKNVELHEVMSLVMIKKIIESN